MKSLHPASYAFILTLALTVTVSQTTQAQFDSHQSKAGSESLRDAGLEGIFSDEPSPIVPVGYGSGGAVGCVDAVTSCDSLDRCDSTGCGCHDDLWTRASMTNGFGGLQPALAKQGIVYDAQLTQFYQGVASGGGDRTFEYGGKLDQFLIFNSKELGLWEGGQLVMHAESRFGQDVNADAALLSPVNINMLYPSQQHVTAITGLQFTQALSETTAVTFGKINALDLFYGLYPQTGRGVTGFINTSLVIPLSLARTVPLSFLGAGVLRLNEDEQIQGGLLVYDSHSTPTTSGFDELFTNGANLSAFWRIFTDLGGLPGSQLVMGTYASGDFTSLDRTGWELSPGQGIVAPSETGSWSLLYLLQQQLWIDPCNKTRNIGLLSQWGLADEETCPYQWVANVAVQAQGVVPSREQDAIGVGYFYNGLSSDFKNLLPLLDVGNVQGVELYYNAALTPWFHLTTDFQVVEPALGARDTAVVVGLRAHIAL